MMNKPAPSALTLGEGTAEAIRKPVSNVAMWGNSDPQVLI